MDSAFELTIVSWATEGNINPRPKGVSVEASLLDVLFMWDKEPTCDGPAIAGLVSYVGQGLVDDSNGGEGSELCGGLNDCGRLETMDDGEEI